MHLISSAAVVNKKSMVMFLNFGTDRFVLTMQTKIRMLLGEQSDQDVHCLQCSLHLFDALFYHKAHFGHIVK